MSLLRNQPVNPLNNPVVADQAPAVEPTTTTGYAQPVANDPMAAVAYAAPAQVPAQFHQPSQVVPAVSPLPLASVSAFNDGFDDLDGDVGYGSFPRVKLDSGTFWMDDQTIGTEFVCNIFYIRNQYIWRMDDGDDDDADVVWTYDDISQNPNALTTRGEPLGDILADWRAQGHNPTRRDIYEASATIIGGQYDGALVLLSIPPTSKPRFAGYKVKVHQLMRTRIPNVLTKVSAGSPIKSKKGSRTFQPWTFEFAGAYQPSSQAA